MSGLLGESGHVRERFARLRASLAGHDWLSIHVRRNRNSEEIEHCRGNVHDARMINVNWAIAEKHAWNFRRIHVVVAAPGPRVVRDDRFTEAASHCLPCDA